MNFPFKNILKKQEEELDQQRQHDRAKEEFALPDLQWLVVLAGVAVMSICGILCWRFFSAAAPGVLGVIIGCLAWLSGIMAFTCWMTISKSAGRFHRAVLVVAIGLTAMDIGHASIEFWKNTNTLQQAWPQIQAYAKFGALPVLLLALTAAGYTLVVFHWRHKINVARADAAEQIAVSAAKLRTQSVLMENEDRLDQMRLSHLDKQLATQRQVIERVKKYAELQAEAQRALDTINDPTLRAEMADQFKLIARIEYDDAEPRHTGYVNGAAREGQTAPKIQRRQE